MIDGHMMNETIFVFTGYYMGHMVVQLRHNATS
jgi:hypothetical protein